MEKQMRLCPNNHYYDQSEHATCPHCAGAFAANANAAPSNDGKTVPGMMPNIGETVPVPFPDGGGWQSAGGDDGKTQIGIELEIGIDPVVGWLVCIEGKEKGKDHRIHSDNNYIGRSKKMDIIIENDDTVSRDNHAIISYDKRTRTFYFAPGSGRAVVYVNDAPALAAVQLKNSDRIEIGNTKFLFVPLCGEEFDWIL